MSVEQVLRLRGEDFARLGRLPERTYDASGGPTLLDLVGVIRRDLAQPSNDVLAPADLLAINLAAAAPDGHAPFAGPFVSSSEVDRPRGHVAIATVGIHTLVRLVAGPETGRNQRPCARSLTKLPDKP